jgi:hypothetical protein
VAITMMVRRSIAPIPMLANGCLLQDGFQGMDRQDRF